MDRKTRTSIEELIEESKKKLVCASRKFLDESDAAVTLIRIEQVISMLEIAARELKGEK